VLAASGLSVAYGGVSALADASISVRAGEVVGFIGPNGAGKTTLFDCLSGFVRPDRGSVTLLGRDVTRLGPEARAKLGLVRSFQSVRLFPALSVRETIAVAFERHLGREPAALNALWFPARRTERRLARRIDNLVQSLGLGPHQDKFVGELSTGTRRVVDLACLLAAEPNVLLLDEPSSGLAQAETEELGPLIGRIGKETGCAVLVIEHDLALVRSLSERMYALDGGRVIAEGTPDDVLSADQVVQSYLAGSEAALRRSGLLAGV
jgi:ABC-type branched-subunit amino acid transport system ATPase component